MQIDLRRPHGIDLGAFGRFLDFWATDEPDLSQTRPPETGPQALGTAN
jgi:hypothetical protein